MMSHCIKEVIIYRVPFPENGNITLVIGLTGKSKRAGDSICHGNESAKAKGIPGGLKERIRGCEISVQPEVSNAPGPFPSSPPIPESTVTEGWSPSEGGDEVWV
jgi:hypothetical protein